MNLLVEGHLHPRPPFEFVHSLAFLRRFPVPVQHQIGDVSLRRAFMQSGRPMLAEIVSRGKVESPLLRYRIYAAALSADLNVDALTDRLAFFLSIDDDVQPLYDRGWDDPAFAAILDRLYGYHQVKFETPFGAAAWAILTQRTAPIQARERLARLIAAYGGTVEAEGVSYTAFPEPSAVAAADPAQLAETLGHTRQADFLLHAAAAFARLDEAFLRRGPENEVRRRLLAIKGIGTWSALLILLRGLGRTASFDVSAERRFLTAARRVYGANTSVEALAARADHYGPWRGYWAHYVRVGAPEEKR